MEGHRSKNKHHQANPPKAANDADNSETFERLVRENSGWMLSLANRILNDQAKAEDAIQNAFSNIHKGLDGFENRSTIKTWIHRIVINEALMILRKKRQLKEQSLDEMLPRFDHNGCRIEQDLVSWETGETQLSEEQTRAIISEEIAKLPDSHRIVLVLRDIEGIPTEEVAAILDLSNANVRVKLHRARSVLKKRLEPLVLRGDL